MFRQTWKKYLPVINILMKRSANGEQSLGMSHFDFERAAGGRKVKFGFTNLVLTNGRTNYNSKRSPLANDLVLLLQENEQSRKLLQNKEFEFAMTGDFQLIIKSNTVESPDQSDPSDKDDPDISEKEQPT